MSDPSPQDRAAFGDRVFAVVAGPWAVAALVLAVTGARLALLAGPVAPPVMPDEAALWLLAQAPRPAWPDVGWLPPWLLGWLSERCGADGPCLRLLAPLAHGITAWLMYRLGSVLFDPRTGFWCAVVTITLPLVMLGGLMIGSLTLMLPLWTLALLALARTRAETGLGPWVALGVGVGLGLLMHPLMALFVPLAMLYLMTADAPAGLWRSPGPAVAVLLAAVLVLPDLVWNAQNGWAGYERLWRSLSTGWPARGDALGALLPSLGLGTVLAGPVLAGVLAWLLLRLPAEAMGGAFRDYRVRLLVVFTVPVLAATLALTLVWDTGAMLTAPAVPAAVAMGVGWLTVRERVGWLRAAVVLNLLVAGLLLRGPDLAARAGWVVPEPADLFAAGRGWDPAGRWLATLAETYDGTPIGAAGPWAPLLAYHGARADVPVRVIGTAADAGAAAFRGLLVMPAALADADGGADDGADDGAARDVRARLTVTLPDGRRRAWAAVLVPAEAP
ncbi:glycosyltransferase family 39 protein [Roseospira goensis]|uniref:Glycosyltransferase RgtA/B/C/D-like domain-containing protein n=1 Tax=Roseospira goensis TaxID=391922 RepID=A0A7W6RXG9_9PROT|nr:glycosyltransferase family 39 protein [Roseospira goensis]MBB4285006.1 hypothetical protein [Roseospira goensis]